MLLLMRLIKITEVSLTWISEWRAANCRGSKVRRAVKAIRGVNKVVRRGRQQGRAEQRVWSDQQICSLIMHRAFKRQFVTYQVLLTEIKLDTQDAASGGWKGRQQAQEYRGKSVPIPHRQMSRSQSRTHIRWLQCPNTDQLFSLWNEEDCWWGHRRAFNQPEEKNTISIWVSILLLKWKIQKGFCCQQNQVF